MQGSVLTITGSNPQVSVMATGEPQAAVDWELVVRFICPSVSLGSLTITSAHPGSLASGAGDITTVEVQPESTRGRANARIRKIFINNRLPLKRGAK
ncbi:MAG: hypothetical protein RIS19_773 [Actinomycetota bacterium]